SPADPPGAAGPPPTRRPPRRLGRPPRRRVGSGPEDRPPPQARGVPCRHGRDGGPEPPAASGAGRDRRRPARPHRQPTARSPQGRGPAVWSGRPPGPAVPLTPAGLDALEGLARPPRRQASLLRDRCPPRSAPP